MSVVVEGASIFIPLDDLVDREKEITRLEAEKARLSAEIERVDKKHANEKFVSKAPDADVAEERNKKEKYQNMLADVEKSLAALK